MSTIEEFENAPVGATAKKEVRLGAWRDGDETDDLPWVCTTGERLSNKNLVKRGYTLVTVARTLPAREQIAEELSGWPIGTGYCQSQVAIDEAREMADAVLDLLKGQDQ